MLWAAVASLACNNFGNTQPAVNRVERPSMRAKPQMTIFPSYFREKARRIETGRLVRCQTGSAVFVPLLFAQRSGANPALGRDFHAVDPDRHGKWLRCRASRALNFFAFQLRSRSKRA